MNDFNSFILQTSEGLLFSEPPIKQNIFFPFRVDFIFHLYNVYERFVFP